VAEATGGVTETEGETPRDPQPLEADVVRRRAQLTRLVGELNRRGHELTDIRLQVRRHALGITASVLAVGVIVASSIALRVWRSRRRNMLRARSGRLREAFGRMIDRPDRVAVEPSATQRLIGSAGSAAAAVLIRAAMDRLIRPPQHAR
jgi:hypothetical protein